ncbi:hypothetical protein FE257_003486 [Aspergillus nanangensis]|uniref:Xylanolytic transcriptional activator regulatory domain-containing protein n=1 Tax=Aspergillus nanangensis TaxID=2582783 RepID=A0AAD4CBW3_ASPNN|nr:hypothetical protein FE257_003486 [Aspergillus nanangensis]
MQLQNTRGSEVRLGHRDVMDAYIMMMLFRRSPRSDGLGTGAELECSYETRRRSNSKEQDIWAQGLTDATHFAAFDLSNDLDEITQLLVSPQSTSPLDEVSIPTLSTMETLNMAMIQSPSVDTSMALFPTVQQPLAVPDYMTESDSSCDLDEPMCSLDIEVLGAEDITEMMLSVDALVGIELIPFDCRLEMYQNYFMSTHPTFPLINQEVFLCNASTATTCHEVLALQSAVCAHGAAGSPKFIAWAGLNPSLVEDRKPGHWFYQHAKYCLGKAESSMQEAPSLVTLQATLLLGLYEVKQAQLSQAWITTSQAAWTVQCLQHTKAELLYHPARQQTGPKTTPLVTDEERNAMWAVLYLNCFLFIGVGYTVIDVVAQNEIGVSLPRQDELDASLRLDDVLTKPEQACQLSVKQRLSIATILCTRTLYHIKMMNHADPLDRNPYNNWTQHYHLDGAIRHISSSSSSSSSGLTDGLIGASKDDVSCSIVMSILLKATAICLHEALIAKVESELPLAGGSTKHAIQTQNSSSLTLQNSLDIAELVQASTSTEEANSSIFLPWSIYVAIQSLLRHQRRRSNPPPPPAHRNDNHSVSLSDSNPTGNCVHCGVMSRSSSFEGDEGMAVLLDEAVVLDAINALRSSLLYLCNKMCWAQFFYDQAQVEMQRGDELTDRVVGMAAFMNPE